MTRRFVPLLVSFLVLPACSSPGRALREGLPPGSATRVVEASTGKVVEANWKERRAQPYVYLDHLGDYRQLGDAMRRLIQEAGQLGVPVAGPPFALFYDDPARVAPEALRSRACLPIAERAGAGTLAYEELPSAMVAYARVRGPYPDLPRSYAALFQYMNKLGWTPGVPIREIYLVDPGQTASYDELVAEVQVPWSTTN